MKFIVFGDIHGDVRKMLYFCKVYEKKNAIKIDLVLQIGDFTLSNKNEDVSNKFEDYISGIKSIDFPVLFIKGHQENFDLLDSHKNEFIDKSKKIYYLNNGSVYDYSKGKEKISISGIGGNRSGSKNRFGYIEGEDKYFNKKSLKGKRRRHFTKYDLENIYSFDKKIDILLLHDSPLGLGKVKIANYDSEGYPIPTGAKELTDLIESKKPEFAFFGHYHNYSGIHKINETKVIGLNHIKNSKGSAVLLDTKTLDYYILDV